MQEKTKLCSLCNKRKELSLFYKHKYTKDKRQTYCKKCYSDQPKPSAEKNKENFKKTIAYSTGKKTKLCILCLKRIKVEKFPKQRTNRDGYHPYCRKCISEKRKNKLSDRKTYLEYTKKIRLKKKHIRLEVIKYYSKNKLECNCCKEKEYIFLTIDHINNDGAKHRKKIGLGGGRLAQWLYRNKFTSGFQILCFNCNLGKYHNKGTCPHKNITK